MPRTVICGGTGRARNSLDQSGQEMIGQKEPSATTMPGRSAESRSQITRWSRPTGAMTTSAGQKRRPDSRGTNVPARAGEEAGVNGVFMNEGYPNCSNAL